MKHILMVIAMILVCLTAEAGRDRKGRDRDPVQRVDDGVVYAKERMVEKSLPYNAEDEVAYFEYKLAMNKMEKSDVTCKGDTENDRGNYTSNADCDSETKICTVRLKLDSETKQYKCSINFFGGHEADKLSSIDLGMILIQDGNLVILNKRQNKRDSRLVYFEHTK